MSKEPYEEFEDAAYTKLRKALLRTKGGPNQEEFLEAARRSGLFLDYLNAVPVSGARCPALVPEPLTEGEFRAPPQDTEERLYSAWCDLTPRVACRSTFWARLTCRHIEAGRIESEYLAGNGGNLAGGGERIDPPLPDIRFGPGEAVGRLHENHPCVDSVEYPRFGVIALCMWTARSRGLGGGSGWWIRSPEATPKPPPISAECFVPARTTGRSWSIASCPATRPSARQR